MGDTNVSVIVGRISQPPKLREAGSSGISVCDITVANNQYGKGGKKTPSFIRCTAWDKQAEWAGKNLRVGDTVSVTGKLVDDNYETTKGDPSTKTNGRLKLDKCDIQVTRWGPNHEPNPESAEAPAEDAPPVETPESSQS